MDPQTVEDVIIDFKGRRLGLIKALTNDVEHFYQLCDPNHPNLCLYGYPNEQWGVNIPPHSDLPEPRLGINFSRPGTGMKRQDWLSMVALHSDAWLHSVVGFLASKLRFAKADRKRLFNKIANFPSICEVTSNELTRKRVKIENCGIPEEIFIEILLRVSAKDLITYRCLSKMWRSLIDNTDFIHTHLNNYKANLEGAHLLVIEIPRAFNKDRKVLVRRSDTYRQVARFNYLDGHVRHDDSKCLGYINGVILLRKGNLKYLIDISLWNPSINQSLRLPDCVLQSLKDASYFELALGFDVSHNDYKVIAIVYPHAKVTHFHDCGRHKRRYHGTVPGLVQVFSLCSNSWRCYPGIEPPPHWTVGKRVFFSGAIHWTNLGISSRADNSDNSGDSHIVSFDVVNEVFSYFKMPEHDNNQRYMKDSFLTVLDDSLALFRGYANVNDIIVMKEYGVEESWSKLYSFTHEIEKLVYFTSKGELLYANEGEGVQSYDVKRKRIKQLTKTYNKTSKYKIYAHVESLVLFGR